MSVNLLIEHHVEFLSLERGCKCSSESTHVKMPHCWKNTCYGSNVHGAYSFGMCLFFVVQLVGILSMIVALPGQIHLHLLIVATVR